MELNCDLGESFGNFQSGNDQAIIPYVDAVNIACGFHAGDVSTMQATVKLAKKHHVHIGAHPGFPDLQGFGRRKMELNESEVYGIVLYQIGALAAFARAEDTKIHHVKPHGALYNMACQNQSIAHAIARAVYDYNPDLILYGLANSLLTKAGEDVGLHVAHEVFADRTYQPDGTLTPRSEENAVIDNIETSLAQVELIMKEQCVITTGGNKINIKADTICVHSDTPEALEYVRRLKVLSERNREK
ncbi:LamB/YcsF family protein [Gracilibacillus oryzae]|uniref:5-oxoprolinase subunit A n=1 Tax=Gracilibacillus oryzae TaxID=1672701 RepID=A0A7C8GR05_9BACI|nr:5-oxoprolinase subunit PxpA [Gracilibacillus oryzae]KAB8125857.1 LamB/YcsF family protein [Gracilibacillus oryzae]